MPDYMNIVKHDETIINLTSDNLVLSVHPMMTENLTSEALAQGMAETAGAAGLDITKMEESESEHENVSVGFYVGDTGDGVGLVVGVIEPKQTDKVVYLFTITYAHSLANTVEAMIGSMEFHPEIIK